MKKGIATEEFCINVNHTIEPGDYVWYMAIPDSSDCLIAIGESGIDDFGYADKDYLDTLADPEFYDADLIYAVWRINDAYEKIGSILDFDGIYSDKYEYYIDKFASELQMSASRLEDIATDVRYLGWFED